jgi:protein-disulfide isomerase
MTFAKLPIGIVSLFSILLAVPYLHADTAPMATSMSTSPVIQVGPVAVSEDQMKSDVGLTLSVYSGQMAIYDKQKAWADRKSKEILAELGAKDAHMSVADFKKREIDGKIVPPTQAQIDGQVQAMMNSAAQRGQPTTDPAFQEQVKKQAAEILNAQAKMMRDQQFYQMLSQKYPITIHLTPPTAPNVKIPTRSDDPVHGPANAKVTLIEFTDFQCPYCRKSQDVIHQILAAYPKDVKMISKQYPLPFHNRAKPSAIAAVCANLQGKFWEFHDKAFAGPAKLEDTDLQSYAKDIGLNVKKFDKCVKDPAMSQRVDEDIAAGQELGVQGTPHFFVNTRVINGAQPFEAFKTAIDQELAAK